MVSWCWRQLFIYGPEVWELTDSNLQYTQSSDKLCSVLSKALCSLHKLCQKKQPREFAEPTRPRNDITPSPESYKRRDT
jgi:hypothetical protein